MNRNPGSQLLNQNVQAIRPLNSDNQIRVSQRFPEAITHMYEKSLLTKFSFFSRK